MSILGWISVIFFAAFMIAAIVFNTAQAVYFIKCFKKKQCSNKDCRFKMFCKKYKEAWTKEDVERIRKLIEDLE